MDSWRYGGTVIHILSDWCLLHFTRTKFLHLHNDNLFLFVVNLWKDQNWSSQYLWSLSVLTSINSNASS
jgi:hypothetical protein